MKKEAKDTRNLYLAREGLVREGTKAAEGVSKTDLQLRTNLEKRKKEMLKDLNRFISKERLCIRNIPMEITDKSLKSLILRFVEPKPKITELKIMKDMKTGKNKGFAFVSLVDHDMALLVSKKIREIRIQSCNQSQSTVHSVEITEILSHIFLAKICENKGFTKEGTKETI